MRDPAHFSLFFFGSVHVLWMRQPSPAQQNPRGAWDTVTTDPEDSDSLTSPFFLEDTASLVILLLNENRNRIFN